MAKTIIDGKEYTCSQIVGEELLWQRIHLETANKLAKMIEDEQDYLFEEVNKRQSKIQDLINQLKDL
jgi:hypothetical protein